MAKKKKRTDWTLWIGLAVAITVISVGIAALTITIILVTSDESESPVPIVVKDSVELPFSEGDSLELLFSGYRWTKKAPVLGIRGAFFCTYVGGTKGCETWVNSAAVSQIRVYKKKPEK